MANTYLSKTFSSSPTGTKKCTISMWVKRSKIGTENVLFTGKISSNRDGLRFDGSNDQLRCFLNGASSADMQTNRKFRDVNSWYHIIIAIDTTQGTASNRMKMYINGVQETSFTGGITYPPQDHVLGFGSASLHNVGRDAHDNSGIYDGSMSHFHFIDGTAYDASAFGETDTTTGEWKAKTSPSVTYGTNGFLILKDGNTITDQSSNSNAFTLGSGTLTDLKDNPDNVCATLNPLVYNTSNKVYGFGNSAITSSPNNSGEWQSTQTTLGASTGKYYCEIKINAVGNYHTLGVGYHPNITNVTSTQNIGELSGSFGYRNNGVTINSGSAGTSLNTYTTGDIIGIAMDLTNSKLYFSKNGIWENNGNPTSGSTGTGSLTNLTAGETYQFVIAPRGSSTYCNFGNGYFGTTAVTTNSGNGYVGAEGSSKFNYTVPTGYSALSTKGLNE